MATGAVRGEKPNEEVIALFFVRHQHFDPRIVGKADLRRSEALAVATEAPFSSEIDGVRPQISCQCGTA